MSSLLTPEKRAEIWAMTDEYTRWLMNNEVASQREADWLVAMRRHIEAQEKDYEGMLTAGHSWMGKAMEWSRENARLRESLATIIFHGEFDDIPVDCRKLVRIAKAALEKKEGHEMNDSSEEVKEARDMLLDMVADIAIDNKTLRSDNACLRMTLARLCDVISHRSDLTIEQQQALENARETLDSET